MLAVVCGISISGLAFADPYTPVSSPSTRATLPRTVTHIQIDGDLDSSRLVQDAAQAAEKTRTNGTDLILLELSGRRWRVDVALGIVEALTSVEGTELVVFLNPPASGAYANSVGSGQAAIAMCGAGCYIAPKARVAHAPGDELASLMPEGHDAEADDRTIRGLVWTALQARGGDALLTGLIPRPTAALFAGRQSDGTWKLASEPVSVGESIPVRFTQAGLDARTAASVGLVSGVARSASEVLSLRSVRAMKTHRVELVSGLRRASDRLESSIERIDEIRRRAKADIDAVYALRRDDAAVRQRRVAAEHRSAIEHAQAELLTLEQLVHEHPELMRRVPPGVTHIGQDTKSTTTAWRTFFQSRRTDLETLSSRVATLAEK